MRPATDRFLNALRSSHSVITEVDVIYGAEVVVPGLDVVTGQVAMDSTAEILARLDITLAEPTRLPTDATSPLSPYGFELAVRRGIRFFDGTTELKDLGVFPIQTTDVTGDTLLTSITALDRAQRVKDARLEDVVEIPAGSNYGDAIHDLIEDGVSGLVYEFATTTHVTPLLVFPTRSDRWQAAQSMARAIGFQLFFNGLGHLVLRPEPALAGADAVWTVDEGEGGVLTAASLRLDRGTAYNKVIAYSTNGTPLAVARGEASDDDPTSPTYYDGPFGHKPKFYASTLFTDSDQCTAAAQAMLGSNLGVARSVNLAAVPNPAAEAGDPWLVRRAALGLNEVHIADVISIGLGADAGMSAESRSRQLGEAA